MKSKIIIVSLFLSIINVYAQGFSSDDKKNIVKTNLASYVFKNYNISYERAILKWLSINVSYGNMPKGSPPFQKLYLPEDDAEDFTNIQLSSSQITIEPRFYLGGKGFGSGFYLAPYYRNSQFTIDNLVYQFYSESLQDDLPITVSGKLSANSFGLLLGNQWFLGKNKNWVIDFWILGGHYGTSKGTLNGNSDRKLSSQEQAELKKEIDGQDIPLIKYTTTTNENGIIVNLDGPWAGLRSGLSFGYRF